MKNFTTSLLALCMILFLTFEMGCSSDDGGSDSSADADEMVENAVDDAMDAVEANDSAMAEAMADTASDDADTSADEASDDDAPTTAADPNALDRAGADATQGPEQNASAGCKLSGNWSGVYYNDVLGVREGISATVTTSGLSITIRTNKSAPPGQFFTGSINGQCGLSVIDGYDGEDWTTKFGGADSTQLRIGDFVAVEGIVNETTSLNVIELYR